MRTKLIILATALVALVVGVGSSSAALQNALQVKMNFKKAGGPGSLSLQLINMDDAPLPEGKPMSAGALHNALYDGGLVPQRIAKIIVQSNSAAYNSKALPYCTVVFNGQKKIPTRADGITGAENLTYVPGEPNSAEVSKNCPKSSIIGKGTFTATVGTPGQPYDPSQAGALEGKIYVYNYKPAGGDQLGSVAMLHVDNPVPANQYLYSGVKKGVLTTVVPKRSEIPTNLDAAIPAGEVSMTSVNLNLTAPKPKKGKKPIFTIKSFSKLDVYGQLVRE